MHNRLHTRFRRTIVSAAARAAAMLVLVTPIVATGTTAHAQAISWGNATNISGDADVMVAGSVRSYALGGSSGYGVVVNGMSFDGNWQNGYSQNGLVAAFSGYGSSSAPYNTLSAPYQSLLAQGVYGNPGTLTSLTIDGLTSGRTYLLRAWVNDARFDNFTRAVTFSNPGSNTVTVNYTTSSQAGTPGQFATGRFTANSSSNFFWQNPTAGSTPAQLNAFQIADVTGLWTGTSGGTLADGTGNFVGGTLNQVNATGSSLFFADSNGSGGTVANSSIIVQAGGISPAGITFQNDAVAFTLGGGAIAGSGAVAKQRSGIVTFTADNSYSGGTTISGGTLQVGAGGTTGSLGSGGITNNAALVVNRTNAVTFGQAISGSGSLTQAGPGTTTLTGGNSYSGGTTISSGTLQVGDGGTTGAIGTGGVVNNGAFVFNRSDSFTVNNAFSGSGSVTKLGAGAIALSASNSFAGGLMIRGGAITFTSDSQLGAAGGTISLDGGTLNAGTVTVAAARQIVLGTSAGYVTITGNSTGTIAGSITGSGGIGIGWDRGTTVLTGSNSYAGTTTIGTSAAYGQWDDSRANPTLRLGNANALPNGNAVAFGTTAQNNTATLDLNGFNASVAGLNASSNARITNTAAGASTLAVNAASGTASYAGQINDGAGAISLVKNGAGVQVLSGNSSYSGGTTINDGILQVTTEAQLGGSGGGITLNGGQLFNNDSDLSLGSARAVTLGSAGGFLMAGWNKSLTVAGQISGSGGLGVVWDAGTVTLSGSNSYAGTTTIGTTGKGFNATAGANPALRLGNANALPAGSLIVFGTSANNNTATLDLNGNSIAVAGLNASANARIIHSGGGVVTLTINAATGTSVYAGQIESAMSVVKTGGGTQTLSGANTYSGSTTISAGKLVINGDQSAATGVVTVAAGAALGGSGTVGGATTIAGSHTPGNSPGVQTFASDLTYQGGSSVQWELAANSVSNSPVVFDQILVGGNLTFSGSTALSLAFNGPGSLVDWQNTAFWGTDHSWLIYDVAGTTTGFANLLLLTENWADASGDLFAQYLPNASFTLEQQGSDVYLTFQAVPEPSSVVLVGIGLVGLVLVRRRRPGPIAMLVAIAVTPAFAQINGVNDNIVSANLNNSGFYTLPTITGLGGDLTVEGWVFLGSYANWGRIADLGSGENSNNILLTTVGTTGRPGFSIRSGGTQLGFIEGANALGTNTWVHVAGVIQTDRTMRLYVNGTQVATGVATGDVPVVNRTSNFLGKSNWSADALLNGAVADVRVWNTARTQTEIQNNMNVGSITGPTTGLVAAYAFGATGAAPTADLSGNGYTATQNGNIVYSKFDTGTLTTGGFSGATTSLNVSQGTLNLTGDNPVRGVTVNTAAVTQGSGSVTTSLLGEGAFQVGVSAGQSGTYTLTGGTIAVNNDGHVQIGASGNGTMNQSGGSFTGTEWIVVGRYAGATGAYNLSGGSLNQTDPNARLIIGEAAPGTLTVSGSGAVNSAGGLSLSHASGGVGTVNLNGGTISTPSVAKGSGGTATLNFNGGTLKATGNTSTFMTGLNAAVLQAGGGTLDDGGFTITVGQAFSGTGGLTKTGGGLTTLTGASTHSGATTVNAGILRIGANGTSGSVSGPLVTNATLAFDRSDNVTVSQAISGTGEVKKWGFGTTTFTGANTFTGDFTHNFGVTVLNRTGGPALFASGSTGNLVISNSWGGDPPVQSGNWSWYGAVRMGAANQLGSNVNVRFEPQNRANAYSYLELDGKDTTIGNLSSTAPFASSWGIIQNSEGGYAGLAASRLTVTQTVDGTFRGEFRNGNWNGGGTIGLTKNGSATLTLADAGGGGISYTGSTIVNAGRLVVSSTNFNSPAAVAAGATFDVNATVDQTLRAAVVVSGSGTFAKSGAARLTLNSANNHTGGTEVNGGALQFTSDNQLGAAGGGIALNGGALYNLDSNSTVSAARTVTLGTAGGYVISGWGKTTTLAGRVTGQGGLGIAFDIGVVMLSGSNDYAGSTTVGTTASPFYYVSNDANPTLRLGNANALPTGNSLVFGSSANNNTATLDLNGFSASVGGMTAGGNAIIDNTAAGTATLTMAPASSSATFSGVIKNTAGAVMVVKNGAGTQILAGNNSYSGTTSINAGTLQIGNGSTTGSLGSGVVVNNAALVFNRSNPMTVANVISGSGSVTQAGLDAVTLTGANTFTGNYIHASGVTVLNRSGGSALFASGSGGNVVIANSVSGTASWYSAVEVGAANQLGANVNVTFSPQNISGNYAYLALRGNDTTIGNLSSTANFSNAWGIVENQEAGSFGNSRLTVTQTVDGTFAGEFRNGFGTSVGTIGLTKNGSATLTLTDAGGATGVGYTGSTIVNAGRLVARNTPRFASSVTVNDGASFAIDSSSAQTWSTSISGSGAFVKQGAGTTTLTVQTTHTGGTIVEAGTLLLSGSNRLAPTSSATVNAGGTLRLNGDQTLASIAGNGAITFGTTATAFTLTTGSVSGTFAGSISGPGYLKKDGPGTLTLTGSHSYTAGTLVSGGTLATAGNQVLPNGNLAVTPGGTLLLGGNQTVATAGGNGLYNLNGYTLTMDGPSATFGGDTAGGGVLAKTGFGTWSMFGTTSGSTAVVLNGGSIKLMGNNRLSDAGAVTVNNGTFDMNGFTDVAGSVTVNGGKIINGTLTAVGVSMNNGSVSGVLTGTGGFTKTSAGTVVISSTSTYTGETAIQGGTLETTGANQLSAASTMNVSAGGTFKMGGDQTLASIAGSGGINLGNGLLTTGSVSGTFAGSLTGNGGLTKVGPGTLTLSGSSSFTGDTNLTGGTLVLASVNALPSDAVVTMAAGAALQISGTTVVGAIDQNGGTVTGGTLLSSLTKTSSGALNSVVSNFDVNGVTYAAGILKQGGGTTTIGAANTFTGAIKLQGGTLQLSGSGSFAAGSSLVMSAGATMDLNGRSQTFSTLSGTGGTVALGSGQLTVNNAAGGVFAGVITGSGGLAKSGAGWLELTGASTYTGPTSITAGELKLNGSLASGSLALAAGATLSGTGSFAGDATIAGAHTPGNSPGIQSIGGNLTYTAGSSVTWELADNTALLADRGIDFDGINVGGNLGFSGTSLLGLAFNGSGSLVNWNDDFWSTDKAGTSGWLLYDVAGSTTGLSGLAISGTTWLDAAGNSLTAIRPDASFALEQVGSDVYLTFAAVPEPSTVVLIGGAFAVFLARRRRLGSY